MKERILTVLKHKHPDRIPWVPSADYWYAVNKRNDTLPKEFEGCDQCDIMKSVGVGLWGRVYEAVYREERPNIKVKRRKQERDIYTIYETPIGSLSTRDRISIAVRDEVLPYAFGDEIFPIKYMIEDVDDLRIARYMIEDTIYHVDYEKFFEQEKRFAEDGLVIAAVPRCALQRILVEFMGFEKGIMALHDHPKEVEDLMAVIEQKNNEAYQIAAESPAKAIWSPENIDGTVTSPSLYKKYCLPSFNKRGEILHKHNKVSMIHIDGNLHSLLPLIRDTDIDVVEGVTPLPFGDVEINEVKAIWNDKVIIWGGIPASIMAYGIIDEEFEQYVINLLRKITPGDNFVLAMGDLIPPDAVFERIKIVSDVVEKYGKYPIKID